MQWSANTLFKLPLTIQEKAVINEPIDGKMLPKKKLKKMLAQSLNQGMRKENFRKKAVRMERQQNRTRK